KGPTAFMNGIPPNGSVGGSINIVSKRAGPQPLTRLTTSYMSRSNLGLHLDVGRRFGDENAWGIRFNGAVRGGDGTIDDSDQNTALVSLAREYQRSDVRWSHDAYVKRDDTDEFRPQINLQGTTTVIPEPPDARTNFYPGSTLVPDDRTVVLRVED